jgi:hypothetical protein
VAPVAEIRDVKPCFSGVHGNDRASLYDEVTDEIITELEAGRAPSVQPWGAATAKAALAMPKTRRLTGDIAATGNMIHRHYDSQEFGQHACCWSGPALSCQTVVRSCWSANPVPTPQAMPVSRHRSLRVFGEKRAILIGARSLVLCSSHGPRRD